MRPVGVTVAAVLVIGTRERMHGFVHLIPQDEVLTDGWCRRCISHAMASGSQTVRLRRARAARSAETGFAPGHGGFTAVHGSAFHPCAGTGWIADFALLM